MEFYIRQGILSLVLIVIGLVIYRILIYLSEVSGKGTIEQAYITNEEKKEKKRTNNIIGKIYAVVLVWIVIIMNVVIYYITKG